MTNLGERLGGDATIEASEWLQVHVLWFRALAADFVQERVSSTPAFPGAPWLSDLLLDVVTESDYLHSIYAYAGWLCGAQESRQAARAATGLELMHLSSSLRDESATDAGVVTAMGDLVLTWSDRLFEEADLPLAHRSKASRMVRTQRDETVVARLRTVINWPDQDSASRLLPGDSIVRPLQIGAVLAGCSVQSIGALRLHAESVDEALRVRADLREVSDLGGTWSANRIVIAGLRLAGSAQRQQLRRLIAAEPAPGERVTGNGELLGLLTDVGAVAWARGEVARYVDRAVTALPDDIRPVAKRLLGSLAERLRL